jgi:hypothetical protein
MFNILIATTDNIELMETAQWDHDYMVINQNFERVLVGQREYVILIVFVHLAWLFPVFFGVFVD